MQRLKIINLITRLILGGAQETALDSTVGLREKGHDVTLVTGPPLGPEGELISHARRRGVEPVILPDLRREIRPILDLAAYRSLVRFFREQAPQVVHTHSSKAGILGRRAARAAGVPIIVHTIHGLPFHADQPWWLQKFYVACERSAARHADQIVVVSAAMARDAGTVGIAQSRPFVTIRSGFDGPAFAEPNRSLVGAFRRQWDAGPETIMIGKVARLFPLKGHEEMIEVFQRVRRENRNAKLVFIGDGILREPLVNLCRRRGIENDVCFQGLLQPEQVPHAFGALDILAHASVREGLARVLPQAVAAGKPVVCYNTDGADEVVREDAGGALVPPGDVGRFARRLLETCAALEKKKEQARSAAPEVIDQFGFERMIDALDDLYAGLVQEYTTIG